MGTVSYPVNNCVYCGHLLAKCVCFNWGGSSRWRVVRWIDSSLQNSQVDKDDFPKPCEITSIGFVVEETDEYIVLARDDMGHDGDYRGLVAIPKFAIVG